MNVFHNLFTTNISESSCTFASVKHISSILFCLFLANLLLSENKERQVSWQQSTSFYIQVELDPVTRILNCKLKMTYTNNSPNTLQSIYFHIWPNAYKNNLTAFTQQEIRNGKTDFYFATEEDRGRIYDLNFTLIESPSKNLNWNYHPQFEDVIELTLNSPLLPGNSIEIQTPFTVKLPHLFSRSGYSDSFFAITQWYPKPAVYDANGWNIIPYLDQGEFYSEFADSFVVDIMVPSNFLVASTGNLLQVISSSGNSKKTYTFSETNIHDFAWFTSSSFVLQETKISTKNNDSVLLQIYRIGKGIPGTLETGLSSMDVMKHAIKTLDENIGPYPYKTCKLVIGNLKAGSGMEYPGITVCSYEDPETIYHEIAHNWFYGILASNERKHPWMDECLTTYFSNRFIHEMDDKLGNDMFKDRSFFDHLNYRKTIQNSLMLYTYKLTSDIGFNQSVHLTSEDFTNYNYATLLYAKGPLLFAYLQSVLGDSIFDSSIKLYYTKWRFKHPLPSDLQDCFEEVSSFNLDWFFVDLLRDENKIDVVSIKDGFIIKGSESMDSFFRLHRKDKNPNPFGLLPERNFFNNGQKKNLIRIHLPAGFSSYNSLINLDVMPVLGYNYYDKIYAGILLNHHFLNKKGLQFTAMPVWSFSRKKPIGYASISGEIYKGKGYIKSIQTGINGQSFSFITNAMDRYYQINPFIKIDVLKPGKFDERIQQSIVINAWNTGLEHNKYHLNDSVVVLAPPQYFYNYLRASYIFDNGHAINRYGLQVNLEYGENTIFTSNNYLKTWFNAVYKYQYQKGKKYFRSELFGGIFIRNSGNVSRQSFYASSMNGYNDYTYSEALLGRSETSSGDILLGKQILSNGAGIRNVIPIFPTDNWMLRLNTDFSLPGILPLRLYADFAYYGYVSSVTTTSGTILKTNPPELYFTGGLVISVIRNTFEIFIPFVQSSQFKNYNNWNYSLANSIGFKLNINRFAPNKVIRNTVLKNTVQLSEDL